MRDLRESKRSWTRRIFQSCGCQTLMKFAEPPVTYDLQKIMTSCHDFQLSSSLCSRLKVETCIYIYITPFCHSDRRVYMATHTSSQKYYLGVISSLPRRNVLAILFSLSPLKWSPFDNIISTALRYVVYYRNVSSYFFKFQSLVCIMWICDIQYEVLHWNIH